MNLHVMNDIETLGNSDNAALLSIGAVKFTGTEIVDTFHVAIDPETAVQVGLSIDASTVMWWLGEAPNGAGQAARAALFDRPAIHIAAALQAYALWYGADSLPTWGNGASFDNVILRNAFRAVGQAMPWEFRHDRCYRTMKGIPGVPPIARIGTHHSALDDARSQAAHLQQIAGHLGITL